MTEEQKNVDQDKLDRKARNKAKTEKKDLAFAYLKELATKTNDEKAIKCLKILRPSLFGMGPRAGGGSSIMSRFVEFVSKKGPASDFDVFKELKIGTKEASELIRRHLRKSDPESRVWISFRNDTYTVSGKGPNPPKGWDSFVPVEAVEDISKLK